jgi:hypothetical protein
MIFLISILNNKTKLLNYRFGYADDGFHTGNFDRLG